ncbi:MAG: sulfate adenylyltransferase subunit CysN [Myxococcales bacterium]|nr:sulfate adenylyltransferase subunit CysN [Myxococcales bacterium]
MSHVSELIATDIGAYLKQHETKELLRFITCGSVDDGKSTLIGRLLFDTKMVYEDHLKALESASLKHGTTGNNFDPALLTDGLKAEREQGITIDVAYRYFSTARRKFIIADTPGHEQYTRNMATGASTADLAIILIDARYGVLTQTRRHSFIVSLLGLRNVVVAINKMDLVGWSEARFREIDAEYRAFATPLGFPAIDVIPMAALLGENVVARSEHTPWYSGPTLMEILETAPISRDRAAAGDPTHFRMPVQLVSRPDASFRGYAGTIAAGLVRKGDRVTVYPSGQASRIARIVTFDGDRDEAFAPEAVTITLEDERDASRGDVIASPANPPRVATTVDATVVWMSEAPLAVGRSYFLKHTTNRSPAVVTDVLSRIDVNTLAPHDANSLAMNEIGRCRITTSKPLVFDAYTDSRAMGAFILIDRLTNDTVAAGMITGSTEGVSARDAFTQALGVAVPDVRLPDGLITDEERRARFGTSGATVFVDGLPDTTTHVLRALLRRLCDLGIAAVEVPALAAHAVAAQGLIAIAVGAPPEPVSDLVRPVALVHLTGEQRPLGVVLDELLARLRAAGALA